MMIKLGGTAADIRELSNVTELDRYTQDFGCYNVALDVTVPDQPQTLVHSTPYELFSALRRFLEAESQKDSSPRSHTGKGDLNRHVLYLHSFSPIEASQILTDPAYAEIQIDIMLLRAQLLGLTPAPPKPSAEALKGPEKPHTPTQPPDKEGDTAATGSHSRRKNRNRKN